MNSQVAILGNVFVTPNGEVFFADRGNHRVRKILKTGQTVTIAGTGVKGYNGDNQPATLAQLDEPTFVIVSDRDEVFISETGHRIRKILKNGNIVTVVGTGEAGYNGDGIPAVEAMIKEPFGLAMTDCGELLFADLGNQLVRKVSSQGIISTVAGVVPGFEGDGEGIDARIAYLSSPSCVCWHNGEIVITEYTGNRVRKVNALGVISTIVGTGASGYSGDGGLATEAELSDPWFASIYNNELYISDFGNCVIRKVKIDGTITTISGTGNRAGGYNGDGILATKADINTSTGVFVTTYNEVYIAEYLGYRIRKIDCNGIISTIAGNGQCGYEGDVEFSFKRYPHIGPKKFTIKPFPRAFHDVFIGW